MAALPVVVAGGGIAGLSTALALSLAGQPVVLFERDRQPPEEGAGVQLSPNASRHLRAWGVLARLEGDALAPEAVVVRRGRDRADLSHLDLRDADARYGAPFRIVHRADLHAALRAPVEAHSGIAVRSGIAVTGWQDGKTLTVTTDDGRSCEAAALVVADGVQSRLRAVFDNDASSLPLSGRVAWRTLLPAADLPGWARAPVSNLWLGPDTHLVHYPLRGGAVVNVVAVVGGGSKDDAAGSWWSTAGDGAALLRRFADWHADARRLLDPAATWRVWPLFSRAAPKLLARGAVALAGDAAHPMMPFLAQGAAQAIEDAAALGDAFAAGDDPRAALARYARARLGRVGRVVAASERQAAIYHLRGVPAGARDLAMQLGGQTLVRAATDWIYRG